MVKLVFIHFWLIILIVHDISSNPAVLSENDIITIEPGIYFNPSLFADARKDPIRSACLNWPLVTKFLNNEFGGVRIEDVVLVTENGNEVLSSGAPKEIQEIERLIRNKLSFFEYLRYSFFE